MYQALYRKYRPKTFDDVAGQEHITETLRSQIMSNRLTHAYLFVGTRGTGKTTCAKILSRAVNCQNPSDGNPCNKCHSCIGIEDGSILDVLEIDAASNNGIDNIRDLRDEAIYSPAAVSKRVYIIDEVHMLSTQAFNALLKILEEPPAHILFVLATTELHKVLPTIQSRCQKFSFRRLSVAEIAKRLSKIAGSEGLTLTADAAERMAMLADGSMRDGVSLLDQCVSDKVIDVQYVQSTLGLASSIELLDMINALAGSQTMAVLEILDKLYKDGKDMTALLNEMSAILRDLLVVKLTPASSLLSSGLSKKELTETAALLSPERLFYCLEIAKNALLNSSRTGISKIILEMCLIKMSNEQMSDEPAALAARIERLETGEVSIRPAAIKPAPAKTPPPAPAPQQEPAPEQNRQPEEPAPDEPAPETPPPTDEPAPETPPPAPPQDPDDDLLHKILENITDDSLRVHFTTAANAEATLDMIVITMTDDYDANSIKYEFMQSLEEATEKATGRKMPVRIEIKQEKQDKNKQSKQESLFTDI